MDIKLYIVTYKGIDRINKTLRSIFDSDLMDYDYQVNIINNHSSDYVHSEYNEKVRKLENNLRPDWSTGHLSRNWNQALLDGFRDLNNPDCPIVVHCQDDCIFNEDWVEKLLPLHEQYNFVQNGHGDQFCSYLPEAVKRVGLWDERLCGISYQAGDYFYRNLMHNKDGCTINDPGHRRLHNTIFEDIGRSTSYLVNPDVREIDGQWTQEPYSLKISKKIMDRKYDGVKIHPWTREVIENTPKRIKCENVIYYPYFEKDIYDLDGKGYIVP